MRAFIVLYPFGILAFDEQRKIVAQIQFSQKPQEAAKAFAEIESGDSSLDLTHLINALKDAKCETVVAESPSLSRLLKNKMVFSVISSGIEGFHVPAPQVAIETGFVGSAEEFKGWLRSFTMELAKLRVTEAVERRDLVVAQAIQTLDDLDRTVNLLVARLREWYGVHFPELDRLIEKHETYARLVADFGVRDNFSLEMLERASIPQGKAETISEVAGNSMGASISETDLLPIQNLAKNILELYSMRQIMESYIDGTMEEVAPNIRSLVGSLLGARLIAIAGSLRNLAMRPASTIQVLGAEKALFRSLKTGARPPKHGLIFQAALLHDAKNWQRGKIARALAGKLSIAARADAFGGRYVGDRLKADLERRIEEIREKYRDPPPPKEKKGFQEHRRFEERREFRERKVDRGDRRRPGKWRKKKRGRKG